MSNTCRQYTEIHWTDTKPNHTYTTTRDGYTAKNDTIGHHKMKPYKADKNRTFFKFTVQSFAGMRNNSFQQREEAKNANRSLKKGKRQELKKELKTLIQNLNQYE